MSGIREWLDGLGLGEYAKAFEAERITLEALPHLTDSNLKELGLPMGPRAQVLAAAKVSGALVEPEEEAERREAERRQLTVMFCDMVGSTELSERLDPEDLREVLRAYQDVCAGAIARLDGYIAQTLGDGIMVYFGFPRAHEDDAQRAIRAGLDIVESIALLSHRLGDESAISLSVRLGVHTGLVVAGEVGDADTRADMAVVGETPNIAARLQSLAAPDTLVIGPTTYALVREQFECRDLGSHDLKGISQPLRLYQVIEEKVAETRFEAGHGTTLTALVSREEEMELLQRRWQQAKAGEGQVVLLSGEAGIGKSRIVQALRDAIASEPHIRMRYQCSPYHTNSAFYPIIEQLKWATGIGTNDSPDTKLGKLEEVLQQSSDDLAQDVPLFADLMSIPFDDKYPRLNLSAQRQKEKTLQSMFDNLYALSDQEPVLYVMEDAHWIDPSTLEALELITDHASRQRILILITYRPEFVPPWSNEPYITLNQLSRLSPQTCSAIMDSLTAGKAMPDEIVEQIVAKTDGVPLFVEELTKAVIESDLIVDKGDHYELVAPLPKLAIPATLQDSLMARLDRLGLVKEVAQIGACVGREFSYDLLSTVSSLGDYELREALQVLVNSELVFQRGKLPDATFTFKHALVEDAAYHSLLKSKRHLFHQRIADALKTNFPETVATKPQSLAHHFTEAGLGELAVVYWLDAGKQATERSANAEAVAHLRRGLELLSDISSSTQRDKFALDLHVALGIALIALKGYSASETAETYAKARELCGRLDDSEQVFPVLYGLWIYNLTVGNIRRAREMAEEFVDRADKQKDRAPAVAAHRVFGTSLFFTGELGLACRHFQQSRDWYDAKAHAGLAHIYAHDPYAAGLAFLALALCRQGFPEQARRVMEEAIASAKGLGHPHTLAYVLSYASWLYKFLGEHVKAKELANQSMALSAENHFGFYLAQARVVRGWAQVNQGEFEAGLEDIRASLKQWGSIGKLFVPAYLSAYAEALAKSGAARQALDALDDAIATVDHGGEAWPHAELLRLKGEIIQQGGKTNPGEVETCFERALELARESGAKSDEIRAATSLARFLRAQGKAREARDALAPVYDWFTEGFDTPDLKDAKALLDELK